MLRHINIGGEVRPVNFGFNALAEASRYLEVDWVVSIKDGLDFMQLRALYWAALKDGARIEKKAFDYSPEDVADWITENMSLAAELRKMFDYDVLMVEMPADDSKKKNNQSLSKPKGKKSGTSTATSK